MRVNKYYYLAAIILTGATFLATWQIQSNAQFGNKSVQLLIKPDKESFSLGEVIGFNFEIVNMTDKTLEIAKPGVGKGNLRLFISADGMNYREYSGPNWGNSNSIRQQVKLDSGENFQTKATVLFNRVTPIDHLTELYAERIRKEEIDTEFAMANAGRYWLKAVFKDAKTTLESEPLIIDISEPVGSDAFVWEKMKTDGAYAYFLQTGSIKYYPGSAEAREFTENLRRIPTDFPNSKYAERLGEQLTKYDERMEKLRQIQLSRQN